MKSMIFPEDPKYVGVCDKNENRSGMVYNLTKYLVDLATNTIYEVSTEGSGIMRNIVGLKIIAVADEIFEYEEPVDIHNRSELIELSSMLCGGDITTVLFRGLDEHITFVHKPDTSVLTEIEIWDVVPPYPSILVHMIGKLKEAGAFNEFFVRFLPRLVNIGEIEGKNLVFPCSCSGLPSPHLDRDSIKGEVKIIGCEISREVVKAMYPDVKYELVSICPHNSDYISPTRPFIARCCRKEMCGPTEVNGVPGYIVHWGARQNELIQAVHTLCKGTTDV
ncbi:hypothetical protein DRN72_00765 [Methanosarcinales archaeon]|nr:MAG: hypothetical protein DRN72_00765 [Methanosarcinales archaeon]